jgi:lysophospholipase L1-like esterase
MTRLILSMLLMLAGGLVTSAADTPGGGQAWVFTYFTGNGADGLHLAVSTDGWRWEALNGGRSVLAPQVGKDRLMRDPCLLAAPDGTFHLVWTTGWWDRGIGHASTRDLVTWSAQQVVPVMESEPTARNAWAPEAIWDDKRGQFLVFWASTIPGRFPATTGASEDGLNHRIYCTTTKDWATFSPTRLFVDSGFNIIDATVFAAAPGRFVMVAKDESLNPPRKHLRLAEASDVEGPWTAFGTPFTRDWVEGPTTVRTGADTLVYFDVYREHRYGAVRSADLQRWEDVSAQIQVPAGARHGTMLAVSPTVLERLRAAFPDANPQPSAPQPAPDLATNPAAAGAVVNPSLPTVFVAGDSTAARGSSPQQQGWGEPFRDFFDPAKVNVVNRARGGRSSRTFITEGLWAELLAQVKPGDFVLIQFGHNDAGAINAEPPGSTRPLRARGSLPGIGEETEEIDNVLTNRHEVVHTFGWYVRKMIADVRAKGATPIVLSLTVRNLWQDGKVERGSGEYRRWDREIAEAAGVAFVDVTRIIADQYQELGEARVKEFFPKDHTHTNPAGAERNAAAVIAGLKGLKDGPWKELLSAKGREVASDAIGWLNLPEPANPRLPTLLLIGDSTVRNGRGDGAGGQWGWGDLLAPKFDASKVNVVNRAIGGLSSRTFLTQGHWARALTLLKPGDVLVLQFGHNDNGPVNDTTRARGTLKGEGAETEEIDNLITKQREVVHTYGWYLRQYVREARARGVIPVICSPVPRKEWREGRIVRSAAGYAGWARQVAEQEQVAFIDLNDRIAARYDALGAAAVNAFFADPHTHTSRAGAALNAEIVAEALRGLKLAPLADAFRGDGEAGAK